MTRVLASLLIAIICSAGCNNSSAPQTSGESNSSTEVPVIPAGPPEHRMDLNGVGIPDAPLAGKINGKSIEVTGVAATTTPEGTDAATGLTFQLLGTVMTVSLPTSATVHVDKKWQILKPSPNSVDYDHIAVGVTGKSPYYYNGFVMRLELGTPHDGKLPGRIYLCFPDEEKSYIAGRFEAQLPNK